MTDPVPYAFGVAGVGILGLAYVIRPWFARRHARKLAARMTRGTDAIHDELRSLQAYTPDAIHKALIAIGVGLMLIGLHGIMPDTLDSARSFLQSLRT